MQLAQEWENHRRPLIDNLRDIKSSKTKVSLHVRQSLIHISVRHFARR